jgi:hypothetical protein
MTTTAFDIPSDGMTVDGCHAEWLDASLIKAMRFTYSYDGQGTFRVECRAPGPFLDAGEDAMAFVIVDAAGRRGVWTGTEWLEQPTLSPRSPDAPVATVDWLNWVDAGAFLGAARLADCKEWQLGERTAVARRPAQEVSCGPEHVWIDEGTHLLVKREREGRVISEALELEFGTPRSPVPFVFGPGAVRWSLYLGAVPGSWTLPTVDGGEVRWESFRGRPTAVLTVDAARPGLDAGDFAAVAHEHSGVLAAVAMASGSDAYDLRGYRDAVAAGIPVVIDDGTRRPDWRIFGTAVWLFDADGRVVAMLEHATRETLDQAITAWLAGDEIPMPPVGDGVFTVGRHLPRLDGAGVIGGDRFELDARPGRPMVVLYPGGPGPLAQASRPDLDSVTRFAAASRLANSDATFAVLTWDPGVWLRGDESTIRTQAGLPFVHVPGVSRWSALRGPTSRPTGGTAARRTVIVIADADGIVRYVISDNVPAAEEIAALVDALGR